MYSGCTQNGPCAGEPGRGNQGSPMGVRRMKLVAFFIGLLVVGLGALGTVSPLRLLSVARMFESPAGILAATALRIVLGTALFLSSSASRTPKAVSGIGAVTFASGVITPFFGLDRFRRVLSWWASQGAGFMRAWAVLALGLGLLIAYAEAPRCEEKAEEARE